MFGTRDVTLNPVAPAALCTLADAKALCGISCSTDDALITSLTVLASSAVEKYCNTIFAARTVTEIVIPEENVSGLMLRYAPSGDVATIRRDDTGAGFVSETVGDYRVMKSTGILKRKDGTAIPASTYEIVYAAGYADADVPPEIRQAVLELTRQIYNFRGSPLAEGIAKVQTADVGSTEYTNQFGATMLGPTGSALPVAVAAMLGPYVSTFAP